MPDEKNKQFLQQFINKNRPLVCLKGVYQIIFRGVNLMIVKSQDLRIGDIRLIEMSGADFVKGLSDFQWSTLLSKFRTLCGVIEYMNINCVERLI